MEKLLTLNKEQLEAKKIILDFLNDDDAKFITITGKGGSGKTFLIKHALQHTRLRVKGATMSHFAKDVLQESLGGLNIQVYTVAKLLNKKIIYDTDGSVKLVFATNMKSNQLRNTDLIILDEVSMIDDKTALELLGYHIKIIAIGDKYQLPPVEQDHDSLFFDNISAELNTVMRFTGPIFDLSELFVSEIKKYNSGYNINKNIINYATNRVSKLDKNGSGYIFTNKLATLVKLAVSEFRAKQKSTSACRIIAYKNSTIDKLNATVRKQLFGDNLDKFVPGEIIIHEGNYSPEITNGKVYRVAEVTKEMGPHNILCYRLTVAERVDRIIYVVAEEGEDAYDYVESTLKRDAMNTHHWDNYKDFVESFATFNYSYAVNVYKVQGATIDNVYILEDEIMGIKPINMKQKFQSMYVAITRARHRVYLYNKKYKVDNSKINVLKNRFYVST